MAAVCVVGALGGCAIETTVGYDIIERERVATVRSSFKHELDLLFVVDDRSDLAAVQTEAAQLWKQVRGNLEYAEGGFPDVHLGVISSDVGTGNAKVDGCTARGADAALLPGPDGSLWLDVDADNAQWSEYELAARLAIPDGGCPFDQPLAAIRRALDGEQLANAGFLRESAVLGIVMVSGDDDCSVDDPSFWAIDGDGEAVQPFRCFREAVRCSGDDVYAGQLNGCIARQVPPRLVDAGMTAEFLRALKPEPDAVVVTGAIGDRDHVELIDVGGQLQLASACADPARSLLPGVRLASFVRDMGGTAAGVCDAAVDTALADTGRQLRDALGHRCLAGEVLDVDPAPGLQFDCVVEKLDPLGHITELDACPNPNNVIEAVGPCWAIKDGAGECGDFPSDLSLQVNWGGDDPMTQPDGVTALVSCVVADDPPVD
jgi:hypothetical protein